MQYSKRLRQIEHMRGPILFSLTTVTAIACTTVASNWVMPYNYSQAIADAEVQDSSNRRSDLNRCVSNWNGMLSTRAGLLKQVMGPREELKVDSVLLETGTSGYPRYEYVYIEGARLRSSFGGTNELDITGTTLHERLLSVSESEVMTLHGRATSSATDGACYFLSVKMGGSFKAVAVYGELGLSGTDSLIKDILAVVLPTK